MSPFRLLGTFFAVRHAGKYLQAIGNAEVAGEVSQAEEAQPPLRPAVLPRAPPPRAPASTVAPSAAAAAPRPPPLPTQASPCFVQLVEKPWSWQSTRQGAVMTGLSLRMQTRAAAWQGEPGAAVGLTCKRAGA